MKEKSRITPLKHIFRKKKCVRNRYMCVDSFASYNSRYIFVPGVVRYREPLNVYGSMHMSTKQVGPSIHFTPNTHFH